MGKIISIANQDVYKRQVLDRSEPLAEGDLSLLTGLAGRPAIAVLNKSDLPPRLDDKALSGLVSQKVEISARTGEGACLLYTSTGQ